MFDLPRLGDLRRVVAAHAAGAGLPAERVADAQVAVTEIGTNALTHGGPGIATLRAWSDPTRVVYEIRGAGKIADPMAGRIVPPPDAAHGRGLLVANRLCDLIQTHTLLTGTVTRLHLRRPERRRGRPYRLASTSASRVEIDDLRLSRSRSCLLCALPARVAGCADAAPAPRPAAAPLPRPPPPPSSAGPRPAGAARTGDGVEYRVTYGFAVPSEPGDNRARVRPPIAQPPAPPLPYLVGMYVGNHPEGNPAYQRISFYFRGAFPSYRFQYVPQVIQRRRGAAGCLVGQQFPVDRVH